MSLFGCWPSPMELSGYEKVGYEEMKEEDQIVYNTTKEERKRREKEMEEICKTPTPKLVDKET
jgi:hypothetical protein